MTLLSPAELRQKGWTVFSMFVLMCSLFNHHLHQRHQNSFADPAGLFSSLEDRRPYEKYIRTYVLMLGA